MLALGWWKTAGPPKTSVLGQRIRVQEMSLQCHLDAPMRERLNL
jgi:hypothetical protein